MANLTTQSINALNGFVEANPLDNFGTVGIIVSGVWSGTISFEGSLDGTTYVPIFVESLNAQNLVTFVTTNGQFLVRVSGIYSVRVSMTAYTSGTAYVVIQGNGAPLYSPYVSVAGYDALSAFRKANTKVRSDGLTALVTDATVVVESTFGFDQQPDSYFQIINTGVAGNTWTVYIAGTNADPSSPDRDVPAYTKIFTVLVGEVGDELKLRDRIIQELNADAVFKNTVFLKAAKATDRAIVHIQSQKFSVSGDFWERPNAGDFNVTVTGSAVRTVGFDNLISRSKPVTISRDRDSPHRLGLFGVTGSVSVTAKELSDLFVKEATNGGSEAMTVNGSVTPVDFTIPASAVTDLFIEDLIFDGQANGIKFGQFLAQNSSLTNGVEVTIKSDDVTTVFPIIKSTEDFKNKWAALSGTGDTFRIDVQAGRDEMLAIIAFNNPFLLRVAGSFSTDDFIRVRIRDNLTAGVQRLNFRVKGFEKEP